MFLRILNIGLTIFLLLSGLFSAGCRPKEGSAGEQKPEHYPLGLNPVKEIGGTILGRKLSQPIGLASDNSGAVYVVDAGNSRLLKFDRDFQPVREAGGYGVAEGLLSGPGYLTLDNNLNLYLPETGNRRISIFDTKLNYVGSIDLTDPDDPLKFGHPAGLVVASYGEIWVADVDNSRLDVFNSVGNFDRFIGGVESSTGYLLNPGGMARDLQGNVLVCDPGNGVVKKFDRYGVYDMEIGGDLLRKPSGIDIDRFGHLWVVDAGVPGIFCFEPHGRLIWSSQDIAAVGHVELKQPRDLTVVADSLLVVSDSGRDCLVIYKILYPD
jgi:streptogramin lyase